MAGKSNLHLNYESLARRSAIVCGDRLLGTLLRHHPDRVSVPKYPAPAVIIYEPVVIEPVDVTPLLAEPAPVIVPQPEPAPVITTAVELELPAKRRPSCALILAVVSDHYGVPVDEIKSERRIAAIVRPRQVAAYLMREMTIRTSPEIARTLGGRDHTTILHATNSIRAKLLDDAGLFNAVEKIKARIEDSLYAVAA